jgi:hypothetical protein
LRDATRGGLIVAFMLVQDMLADQN